MAAATTACADALRAAAAQRAGWQARAGVRLAARGSIGDTGLLDYVLKTLHTAPGVAAPGERVQRRMNGASKTLEYRMVSAEEAAAAEAEEAAARDAAPASPSPSPSPPRAAALAAKKKGGAAGAAATPAVAVPAAEATAARAAGGSKAAAAKAAACAVPTREEALADLHTLHRCVLEAYLPAKAAPPLRPKRIAPAAGADADASASADAPAADAPSDGDVAEETEEECLRGAALVSAALVVHDTKMFIKDFCGEAPPPRTSALLPPPSTPPPPPPRSDEVRSDVSACVLARVSATPQLR